MQKTWRFIKKLFIVLFILQFVYILLCKWVNPPITITQMVSWVEGNGLNRDYINYTEMGEHIKLAVIASEDQRFASHNGFDVKAIKKAVDYNEKHPGRTRGASTISQQVAKNVFLWQHGGYFRKALEVYFTFMIELLWSKQRILETYLNVAEMGNGIFGIQAAAKAYFNKDADKLTRPEAAMIAACLPNPKVYTVKPPGRYVTKRYQQILKQMNNLTGFKEIEGLLE
ncbi:MAG TPA: monofunctional biosynthetic peptidoglycan transglycosylase [Ferruginibacter sp.]|nr:monofunctional biosynthetic peptidoglycan transglycosylase [Ferruginibacter sp.]HMP19897.1 monofunctional biosynthetic peptidoglycan transglycosylase [Ferruginibacter sp.]